ncbi:CREB/ATF bZIP transcription factor isoform X2 [Scomber scombrus]|uniref:CREB/ATF bZIP transcription factor isoform X2 n=1 Tax=Scomber scombrus TaxID=13677 RepID=A0AAV1PIZ3_SCOSC
MITRRRGRALNNSDVQSLQVEVVDAVETIEDLPSSSEGFLTDDIDTAGIELDDLFGVEDIKWTLERDAASSLFDMELADLGVYSAQCEDSGAEASSASSPERMSSDVKIKNKQNQSRQMINKNAIAARLNRLKKKEYVTSLEKKVGVISVENNILKQENSQLTKRVQELEDETRGLIRMTMTMLCQGSV